MEETGILTERFLLRPLNVDDATDTYLDWLSDDRAEFISTAHQVQKIDDLRAYIASKTERPDVLFLGIFDRKEGSHIGNVKFEPVDSELGYAIMGILVGDTERRGKGVAAEVISECGRSLKESRNIRQMILGVETANAAAIRAYEKIGFDISETPYLPNSNPEIITMCWNI